MTGSVSIDTTGSSVKITLHNIAAHVTCNGNSKGHMPLGETWVINVGAEEGGLVNHSRLLR
jgi:hypothetical protein